MFSSQEAKTSAGFDTVTYNGPDKSTTNTKGKC